MFDLEQKISEWRKQMLAAGIHTPVPLEELDIHLREEIQRQMKFGENERHAFEIAAAKIGQPKILKTEFTKIQIAVARRILAALWFAGCLWSFVTVCRHFAAILQNEQLFLINSLAWFIYAAGIFGSILLFLGSKYGISIIRMIALVLLIACLAEILANFRAPEWEWQVWCGFCAVFSAASIWLLHSPKKLKTIA